MSVIDPALAKRISETIPLVSVTTMYGRDACCAEVESSKDPAISYQVLVVVDQGDVQASCRCPYWRKRGKWCKHILATLIRYDQEATKYGF